MCLALAHPVSGTSLPAPGSQVEEGREGRAHWSEKKELS